MLNFKNILCPIDFSEPSTEGLQYAIDLAAQFKAELSIVHILPVMPALPPDPNFVFKVPEYERALHQEAEKKLQALAEEWVPREIRAQTILGHGDAGNQIVRIAEEQRADLIVITTHGQSGWRHLVFGSVVERVVRTASCPVLTIRAPRRQ